MNIHAFQQHTEKDNWIHSLPAGFKLSFCLVTIGVISLVPLFMPTILIFGMILLFLAIFSQTPLSLIMKRLLLISPLCLFLVLTQIFLKHLSMHETTQIIFRALFSMTTVILLISTTSINSIIKTLEAWGFPQIMIALFTFMFRFIYILLDELEKMSISIRLRQGQVTMLASIHLYSRLLGLLFIRSYDRSQRVYDSMIMRGYLEDPTDDEFHGLPQDGLPQ